MKPKPAEPETVEVWLPRCPRCASTFYITQRSVCDTPGERRHRGKLPAIKLVVCESCGLHYRISYE